MDTRKMAADTLPTSALVSAVAPAEPALPVPSLADVYEANVDYVFRCLRSLGVRGPALDDAIQDVFIVVQDKLAVFDGRGQLRTWLYAIALRVARRYRTRFAIEASKFVDGEPLSHADGEHAIEQAERLSLARRALDRLDDDKREIFVLGHIEQMSAPEIAEITGLPVNTVYSRLRAARLAFNAQITRLTLRDTLRWSWLR